MNSRTFFIEPAELPYCSFCAYNPLVLQGGYGPFQHDIRSKTNKVANDGKGGVRRRAAPGPRALQRRVTARDNRLIRWPPLPRDGQLPYGTRKARYDSRIIRDAQSRWLHERAAGQDRHGRHLPGNAGAAIRSPVQKPDAWTLQRIDEDRRRYRALFRQVGEPWLWFSRAVMPDDKLAGILNDPRVEAYALRDGTSDVGLLELDFRSGDEVELAFFGLVPGHIGRGAGRFLMNEAIGRAFARPIRRLFVHTCTLDSPGALPFYIRSGFTPYRRDIEVVDDPRLLGLFPLEAAPHIPVLVPAGNEKGAS
ncbi:GNAT family N-acetyltransferase [Microvirga aerilata]|uniref:GNAT family N-acetyltransferase n=1 Tax=Microvirga aerilata TaxID=670292 RepID=UPI00364156D0